MHVLKKIYLVNYYLFKRTISLSVFFIIFILFKLNIYLSFLKNYYLIYIYELNLKGNYNLSKEISNFFILKKGKYFFNFYFLNTYFHNNGMKDYESVINEKLAYQK